MVNTKLFATVNCSKEIDTINKAGGIAHSFSDEHTLCQFVCTGTFNGTYYASDYDNYSTIKGVVERVWQKSPDLILKAAIYGRQKGKMKDIPAYLLAFAASNGVDLAKFDIAWDLVINNTKMLLNFCQIIRSGKMGRRSFGTHLKKLIQHWIVNHSDNSLFAGSFGHSNPSLRDVIRMVHPRPINNTQKALLGYITGNDDKYNKDDLPQIVKTFELLKSGETDQIPNIPFMALNNVKLSTEQWKDVARHMTWNTLRMNLNNIAKHGVFDDPQFLEDMCNKIRHPDNIKQFNAFPYEIFTAYKNLKFDNKMKYALQDALEIATDNVPAFEGKRVVICPDLSGSMHSPVTGHTSHSTTVSCYDVVGLMTTTILRKNPDAIVVAWADLVQKVDLNAYDSIPTNISKICQTYVGGGTDSSLAIKYLNKYSIKADLIIYISDNQSWIRPTCYYDSNNFTELQNNWNIFKKSNKGAKLVCIDIQPGCDTQISDTKDILNIGGFNDSIFDAINEFVNNENTNFVQVIEEVRL